MLIELWGEIPPNLDAPPSLSSSQTTRSLPWRNLKNSPCNSCACGWHRLSCRRSFKKNRTFHHPIGHTHAGLSMYGKSWTNKCTVRSNGDVHIPSRKKNQRIEKQKKEFKNPLRLWILAQFFVTLRILTPQKWLFGGPKNTPAIQVQTLPLEGPWGFLG